MATLPDILRDASAAWTRQPPASETVLRALVAGCDFSLPDEYLAFLRYSNGGEGPLSIEPGRFQIWPAEEVLAMNQGYGVEEFLPGFFGIGSSGGGEMLTLRRRAGSQCPVYTVPFIVMAEHDAIKIADDFETFALALGHHKSE